MEAYLHEHIPLSLAMETRVVEATSAGVTLGAPLEPNVNHRETAFGGSVAALAILAGWSLMHLLLGNEGIPAHTVIQTSEIRYLAPIAAPFEARARPPASAAWQRFLAALKRKGRGRVRLEVEVRSGGTVVATLEGAYVSFGRPHRRA
ncbi:MAG: thioesterase domain-containing protein [Gemmatimonadetes bacterium]|nr:thioesterase domain-containing protein [Gemmatimonadota bacterium]